MTKALPSDNCGAIACFDDLLLVIRVGLAFRRADEARTHLYAHRSQSQGCSQSPTVGNAASRDDGNIHSIHHLRHQRQGGYIADVTARFHTLGNEGIHS